MTSPHTFPPRLPLYAWACFQLAALLYVGLLAAGLFRSHSLAHEAQLFLVGVFGAGSLVAVILGFMMRLFIEPDKETDSARFVGRFLMRLTLQCGLFTMPGLAGLMLAAMGIQGFIAMPFAMAGLLLIGSLLPWTLRGVAACEAIARGEWQGPPR